MTTSHDPYTPPAAALQDLPTGAMRDAPFFVVSTTKLVALSICSLGVYQLFWFYMHWWRWRAGSGERVWPVARAIFALFYVHALERRIGQVLDARSLLRHRWTWGAARLYLVLTALDITSALAWPWVALHVRPAQEWAAEWSSMFLIVPVCICMVILQRAANAACGDPDAVSNRRFTLYNAVWMLAGISLTAWVFHVEVTGLAAP